ncbi:hypothetical protein CHY_0299 [Carboxydothermus hydrogenoformans Z-2901]|uniref:Uncharacterized protein n=1 Tax=Carboxydothermus hydrogenoformans (strain ATCC BAA-161 / DSM 6008 / Z-2901) TaxID=246194 RepID=Q3AFB4_CARHZ|nr:hypothetical protein CHY_0299 [Carboxydothermus hydrogenoformans Z-2901]
MLYLRLNPPKIEKSLPIKEKILPDILKKILTYFPDF